MQGGGEGGKGKRVNNRCGNNLQVWDRCGEGQVWEESQLKKKTGLERSKKYDKKKSGTEENRCGGQVWWTGVVIYRYNKREEEENKDNKEQVWKAASMKNRYGDRYGRERV